MFTNIKKGKDSNGIELERFQHTKSNIGIIVNDFNWDKKSQANFDIALSETIYMFVLVVQTLPKRIKNSETKPMGTRKGMTKDETEKRQCFIIWLDR